MQKLRAVSPIMLLRLSMGFVFVWTGVLKLFNVSPVNDVLVNAIPALGESQLLLFITAFLEILIGAALLADKYVKFVSIVMMVTVAMTTVAVLVTQGFAPRFPVLSLVGEHALKNIVFIAAGLVLFLQKEEKHHVLSPTEPEPHDHTQNPT